MVAIPAKLVKKKGPLTAEEMQLVRRHTEYGESLVRELEFPAGVRPMKSETTFVAASRGYLDDIIKPRNTRRRICRALAMLRDKQLENPWKKHDNIPL